MEKESSLGVSPEINFFDVLIALARRKWFIIIFTAIFSIAAVIYSLLTPEIWRSSTKFITISDDMSAQGLGASMLGDMGLGFLGGSATTAVLNNLMYLDSRELKKRAIKEFNMIEYFKIKEEKPLMAMELALKKFNKKIIGVFWDDESDAITITARTESPQLSQDIVNFFLNDLQTYNLTTKTSKGKLKREFLEKRVSQVDAEFIELTNQVSTLQNDSKIISLGEQTSQILSIYAEVIAEKSKNDVTLSLTEKLYGTNNPQYNELKLKSEELQKQIVDFERDASISEFIIPIEDIPDVAMQFKLLEMKLRLNRTIYEFIYPQYEMAKIEEIKDLPTIDVIEKADIEGLRVKPKRAMICVIAFVLSFILASIIVIVIEFTSNENKRKFAKACRMFFSK